MFPTDFRICVLHCSPSFESFSPYFDVYSQSLAISPQVFGQIRRVVVHSNFNSLIHSDFNSSIMKLRWGFGRKATPPKISPKVKKPTPKTSKPVTKAPSDTAKSNLNVVTENLFKEETTKLHKRLDDIESHFSKMDKTLSEILSHVMEKSSAAAVKPAIVKPIAKKTRRAPPKRRPTRLTRSKSATLSPSPPNASKAEEKELRTSPSKGYNLRRMYRRPQSFNVWFTLNQLHFF